MFLGTLQVKLFNTMSKRNHRNHLKMVEIRCHSFLVIPFSWTFYFIKPFVRIKTQQFPVLRTPLINV